MGWTPQSLNPLETTKPETTNSGAVSADGKRTLPDNYTDAERELKRYRAPAAMVVAAVDGTVTYLKTRSLAKEEKEQGETAIATVLYEEGLALSGRLLLLLWIITVLASRAVEFFENRRREAEARRNAPPVLTITNSSPVKHGT